MKINYSVDSALILDDSRRAHVVDRLKAAGVDSVWLFGYFFGHMHSDIGAMKAAKKLLEGEGFEVGVISLPVGHPGNALDPEIDDMNLLLPGHWRYREDRHGEKVLYCADVEDRMIADNAEAVRVLNEAGFGRVFMDDDTRMGNFGGEVQGCFCDSCIAGFNAASGENVTREELSRLIESGERCSEVLREWTVYNCEKIERLMKAAAAHIPSVGIMAMNAGDERHGVDIKALRREIPGLMVRVGEMMFDDNSFGTPRGKMREYMSVLGHLNLTGRERTYSETTGYPPRTLSPENYVYKAKMALTAGVENIFYMSGFPFLDDDYWAVLEAAEPELRALAAETAPYERSWPVHIAAGTHGSFGEGLTPPYFTMLTGLPAKPVRYAEAGGKDADILLWFGGYELTPEWKEKLSQYKTVIMDAVAARINAEYIKSAAHIAVWDRKAGAAPYAEDAASLRELIEAMKPDFPRLTEGSGVVLTWLKDGGRAVLFNTQNEPVEYTLEYRAGDGCAAQKKERLAPLGFSIVRL